MRRLLDRGSSACSPTLLDATLRGYRGGLEYFPTDLLDCISEMVIVQNAARQVVWANRAAAGSVGKNPEELLGRTCFEIWGDSTQACAGCAAANCLALGQPGSHLVTTPDGQCWESRIYPFSDRDGRPQGLIQVSRDVTSQKRMEEDLRESAASFRGLFDSVGEAIYILGQDGAFLDANRGAVEMYGYPREDFIGQTPEFLLAPGLNDLPRLLERIPRAVAGEPQQFELWGRRQNGEIFPKDVRLNKGRYFGKDVVVVLAVDLTARKREEAQRLEEARRMQETQRMESLGMLAGGIAHDFNNLLMGVLGYADLALLRAGADAEITRYLGGIRSSAQRLADLTQQMLAYSGKGQFLLTQVDLSPMVVELRSFLETSISKKALLKLELVDPLPRIEADARQIRQVILNLVMNAAEAIGEHDGIVTVRTGEMVADQQVFVEVSDTGCGMDEETQRKIFDPFFTTKFTGRGLGLAAVQGIVRGHGGSLSVRSEPGRGSVFTVRFPAARGQAASVIPCRAEALPQGGSETLLLVDDEDAVRDVARRLLEQAGFRVITASSGDECLEIVASKTGEIDLVVMDLCMPRVNGVEALAELKRLRADLPVILSSGYHEREAGTRFGRGEFSGFLQKPYQAGQLIQKVREVLDLTHR